MIPKLFVRTGAPCTCGCSPTQLRQWYHSQFVMIVVNNWRSPEDIARVNKLGELADEYFNQDGA